MKRTADRIVLLGQDIPDAKRLFQLLSESDSVIKFFYIENSNIEQLRLLTPKSLKPVCGTMKTHQLWTQTRGAIAHRIVSCFCTRPTQCSCFALTRVSFNAALSTLQSMEHNSPDDVEKCHEESPFIEAAANSVRLPVLDSTTNSNDGAPALVQDYSALPPKRFYARSVSVIPNI